MSPLTIAQIKGLNELIEEAIDAATVAIAEAQRSISRQPYAILRRLPLVAAPSAAIECCQETVTDGVYLSIRTINHLVGATTAQIIARLEDGTQSTQEARMTPGGRA